MLVCFDPFVTVYLALLSLAVFTCGQVNVVCMVEGAGLTVLGKSFYGA